MGDIMLYGHLLMPFNDEICSVELVFLYVKKYKCIENMHINLNPKFETLYDKGILEIKDSINYIPKEEFSNVKLICGENGTGKTSVLEIIRDFRDGNIIVMKTKDKFISNDEIMISYNGKIYDYDKSYSDSIFEMLLNDDFNYHDGFDFRKNFVDLYIAEREMFNDIDKNLLTHFKIDYWKDEYLINIVIDLIKEYLSIHYITEYTLEKLRDEDMISYLFYMNFRGAQFKNFVSNNREEINGIDVKIGEGRLNKDMLDDYHIVDRLIRIRKISYCPDDTDKIYEIINKLKRIIGKEFPIERYQSTVEEFKKLSYNFDETTDKIMHKKYQEKEISQSGNTYDLFYFRGFKKVEGGERYIESLSSGEFISVRNRYNLCIKMCQYNLVTILEDEPDLHLHPEWSRIFIKNYFDTVSHVREYLAKKFGDKFRTKIYNFVMTTHSPLILSDFFKEEVIFFQKENGKVSIRKTEEISDCFAGNIGDMLIDNFFLSKTIGGYSEKKINDIIDRMDNGEPISDKEKKDIEFIISHIGDKLLRRLLEEKFNRVCKRSINENN